jgi:hypothetical protein
MEHPLTDGCALYHLISVVLILQLCEQDDDFLNGDGHGLSRGQRKRIKRRMKGSQLEIYELGQTARLRGSRRDISTVGMDCLRRGMRSFQMRADSAGLITIGLSNTRYEVLCSIAILLN